jgi:protein HOOK3
LISSRRAPDYFDHTTIARHLGDNWALKNSNLRKLLRNIEQYYHNVLHRDYDNGNWSTIDLQKMARTNDRSIILVMCQLVIGAAVTCPEKQIYIQRIMEHMTPDTQVNMKHLIQQSLSKLTEYHTNDADDDNDDMEFENNHDSGYNNNDESNQDDDGENELVFGRVGGMYDQDMNEPTKLFHSAKKKGTMGNDEHSSLQQQLDEAVRELASMKLQATITAEEYQKSESKLSALIEDLQDRLMKRQDDLILVEEELRDAVSELEETKSKLREVENEKSSLEDDLDVMRSKAQQLHKAEAMVVAYKKKLDSMGSMNQQMEDLEGQAEKYLRQIMTLESEVKKSTALQKTVSTQEETIRKLEKTIQDHASTAKIASMDIEDLKNRLQAAEKTKKMYEDELNELRMKHEIENDTAAAEAQQKVDESTSSKNNDNSNAPLSSDQREKMMRLEIENQQLREQVLQMESASTPPAATSNKAASTISSNAESAPFAVAVPASISTSDTVVIDGLRAEIQRLTEAYQAKEQENIKIASDKDKLEAYTKRTLAKFQDKYLVALQECKAKLKEKQDKIELLEKRSQTERNVQKREERLLSSAIYELGLGIMQNKLKSTTTSTSSTMSTTTTATGT